MCGKEATQKRENGKMIDKWLPENTILNGRYLIVRVLGEGGFGITYLARDLVVEQTVAIKEYFPMGLVSRSVEGTGSEEVSVPGGEQREYYQNGLKRFLEEAQNLQKFCECPGIVNARDFFTANGTAYLVMDYIDGQSLKQYMKWYMQNSPGHVPMDYHTAIAFLEPVMKSLAQMHQAGVIHRDISPDNILVDQEGKVTLIDFGAARVDMGDELRSMTVMVKQGYAPEEQYRRHGRQGTWTDVYALCATLYHMISGKLPEESVERLYRDEVMPLKKLPLVVSVPETISDTIEKGMAVRAENRCRTVGELWQKLKTALDEQDRLEQEEQRKQEEKTRQENVDHVKTILTDETDKKETYIDIEQGTQKKRNKNKKAKIIAAMLSICVVGTGGWAGVNWLKDQSHYVKLTDYVSLDSYIEGDSRYILSKKEVEKLKIWKDDYYTEFPQILYDEALKEEEVKKQIETELEEEAFLYNWESYEKYKKLVENGPEKYALMYLPEEEQISFFLSDGTIEKTENIENVMEKLEGRRPYQKFYPNYVLSISGNSDGQTVFDSLSSLETSYILSAPLFTDSSEAFPKVGIGDIGDNSFAAIACKGKAGYITEDGEIQVPLMFADAGNFSEGLAPVSYVTVMKNENGKETFSGAPHYGYIDESGQLVIPSVFNTAEPFSEGLAEVSIVTYPSLTMYWGYVDKEGNLRYLFRPDITGEKDNVADTRVKPISSYQAGAVLVGYRQMNGINSESEENSCNGGYYLFDENGTLQKSFDENYELANFMPCGLAMVHDFTGITMLWDECKDSAQFTERLKEAHEKNTQEDYVDVWYINTKGEQVGETMHMSVYDLAEFEATTLAHKALDRFCYWIPDWW